MANMNPMTISNKAREREKSNLELNVRDILFTIICLIKFTDKQHLSNIAEFARYGSRLKNKIEIRQTRISRILNYLYLNKELLGELGINLNCKDTHVLGNKPIYKYWIEEHLLSELELQEIESALNESKNILSKPEDIISKLERICRSEDEITSKNKQIYSKFNSKKQAQLDKLIEAYDNRYWCDITLHDGSVCSGYISLISVFGECIVRVFDNMNSINMLNEIKLTNIKEVKVDYKPYSKFEPKKQYKNKFNKFNLITKENNETFESFISFDCYDQVILKNFYKEFNIDLNLTDHDNVIINSHFEGNVDINHFLDWASNPKYILYLYNIRPRTLVDVIQEKYEQLSKLIGKGQCR